MGAVEMDMLDSLSTGCEGGRTPEPGVKKSGERYMGSAEMEVLAAGSGYWGARY